jgi:TPR repeat protein
MYLRFVPLKQTSYALEQVATDPKTGEVAMVVMTAHLNPLGDHWYAMHWLSHDHSQQGYTLIRIEGNAIRLVQPAGQSSQIALIATRLGGIATAGTDGINLDKMSEKTVLDLLSKARDLEGYSYRTFELAEKGYPFGIRASAFNSLIAPVMHLKPADFGGSAGLARYHRYFYALAEEGHGAGYYGLARLASNGWGRVRDEAYADAMAAKAVEAGVGAAHAIRGFVRMFGQTTPYDNKAAVEHFRLAIKAGENRAYAYLGLAYYHGYGVDPDLTEARRLYQRGAEQGDPLALIQLADMMIAEPGRGTNKAQIIALLEKAAAHENLHAIFRLAEVYEWESDTWEKAAMWMRRAAHGGHAEAQSSYGQMLDMGIGIAENKEEARRWIRLAASNGSETAAGEMTQQAWKPLIKLPANGPQAELYSYEMQDWGVPTDARDRPGYHERPQTPLSAPGARTITTTQLATLSDSDSGLTMIDVSRTGQHGRIPGALIMPEAGH